MVMRRFGGLHIANIHARERLVNPNRLFTVLATAAAFPMIAEGAAAVSRIDRHQSGSAHCAR
jgi:hypothetical protein